MKNKTLFLTLLLSLITVVSFGQRYAHFDSLKNALILHPISTQATDSIKIDVVPKSMIIIVSPYVSQSIHTDNTTITLKGIDYIGKVDLNDPKNQDIVSKYPHAQDIYLVEYSLKYSIQSSSPAFNHISKFSYNKVLEKATVTLADGHEKTYKLNTPELEFNENIIILHADLIK